MPLVTTIDLFKNALKGGYALGAFNINNLEAVKGVLEACAEHRAPVIISISTGAIKYGGIEALTAIVKSEAERIDIPVAMHLDHGPDLETVKLTIGAGFTSVMYDGSSLPYEENVANTKEVVEYAHEHGIPVEAELGTLAGIEDHVDVKAENAHLTDPEQAVDFVKRTGCDSLAVAIGTSHGAYKFESEPKLDFDRLAEIEKLLPDLPIVLHGSSSVPKELVTICNEYGGGLSEKARGVPPEMVTRAANGHVCKVNIDTDLRIAFTGAVRKALHDDPPQFDPRKILGPGRHAIYQVVVGKLEILGCKGKA